jgi:nucleoside-diphosphate-sugar epimerase
MKVLVTGSAGHLGHALAHTLLAQGHAVTGIDILASPHTTVVGSIVDRELVARATRDVEVVYHAATLHKPHVATHTRQEFVDTNVTGTLNLLEAAVAAGVRAFLFTSSTSAFGDALVPPPGEPASWITEDVVPVPKNIYGATKSAAEDLCRLFHRNQKLPCLVLRTSRFFPEADDNKAARDAFADANLKTNEFLYRRVALDDIVTAHLLAAERARAIGFRTYIISATSPFSRDELAELRRDAPTVVARHVPEYADLYAQRGWRMLPSIDRVYVNDRARHELDWQPRFDFRRVLHEGIASPLVQLVGSKGYHAETFTDGPYPTE